jgi:hypothetical protein
MMIPKILLETEFNNLADLDDFLSSDELTAVQIREDLQAHLKRGGNIKVTISGSAHSGLVLKSALNPDLIGTSEGDVLVVLPFA